jgi:hypothetical protein
MAAPAAGMDVSGFPADERLARSMTGQTDWGMDWPERRLPAELLARAAAERSWVDADGYTWGWPVFHTGRDDGGDYACVANLYHGLGYHSQKVFRFGPDDGRASGDPLDRHVG